MPPEIASETGLAIKMARIKLTKQDIRLGEPIAWNIYNAQGNVLLKKGLRIHSSDRLDQLLRFELYRDPTENAPEPGPDSTLPGTQLAMDPLCKHPFDALNRFALELKPRYEALQLCESDSYRPISLLANQIHELSSESPDCCLGAVHLYYPHSYSLMHPVYSAVMCALTAQVLQYDRERTVSLCSAALTANLGMYRFQDELNQQKAPLDEKQKEKISQHPHRSAQMLQAAGLDNSEWLDMVLQHHERDDRSGYPLGVDSEAIHPGSKIISLADSYLAMISHRAYRSAVQPNVALKNIYKLANKDDPTAFLAFIKTLGVFPPGTFVTLENGEIAVVTARSEEDSLKCQVLSVYDSKGTPLKSPVIRDTSDPRYAISNTCSLETTSCLDFKECFEIAEAVA